jgi:hypothetical protein
VCVCVLHSALGERERERGERERERERVAGGHDAALPRPNTQLGVWAHGSSQHSAASVV